MSVQKKNLSFNNIDEILQFAIEKEEEARTFYELWSQKVKKQSIKEVLLEFAVEEQKHKELLLNVKAGRDFNQPKNQIIDLKLGDYFTEVKAHENMTYEAALRIAIQREMGANQLYQYLASIAENQQIKELFNRLALEELKHKMRLEGMYDENFLSEN
ncbi:ferritin family protein [Calditrichota bacterium LG25]